MSTIKIVLTTLGVNTGPTLDVYAYAGGVWSVVAIAVPKGLFLSPGYVVTIPDDTSIVRITNHLGVCINYLDLYITTTTTTTV